MKDMCTAYWIISLSFATKCNKICISVQAENLIVKRHRVAHKLYYGAGRDTKTTTAAAPIGSTCTHTICVHHTWTQKAHREITDAKGGVVCVHVSE